MTDNNVKNQIISSARLHFSKYGFHKTTMDEIARHLHKAKGVLYYYFKSKEDLFKEVLKQELDEVKTELNEITMGQDDSLNILKKYILTRLKLLSKAVNYHETIKADFFDKYNFVKEVRDDFSNFEYRQIYLILSKGIQENYFEIVNINSTVNAVLMLLYSIEIPLFLQNKFSEYENTIEEIVTMIISSVRLQKK